jgi:hypothetical protein
METFNSAYWVEHFLSLPEEKPASPREQQPTELQSLPQSHGLQRTFLNTIDSDASQNLATGAGTEIQSPNQIDLPYHIIDDSPMQVQPWELQLLGNQQEQPLQPGPIFDDDSTLLQTESFTSDYDLSQHFDLPEVQDFEQHSQLPNHLIPILEYGPAQLMPHLSDSIPVGAVSTFFNNDQNILTTGATYLGTQREAIAVQMLPNIVSTVPIAVIPPDMTTEDSRTRGPRPLLPKSSSSSQVQVPISAASSIEVSAPTGLSFTRTTGLKRRDQDSGILSTRRRTLPEDGSDSDTANRQQHKKRKDTAAAKPYIVQCHKFALPANTGKERVPGVLSVCFFPMTFWLWAAVWWSGSRSLARTVWVSRSLTSSSGPSAGSLGHLGRLTLWVALGVAGSLPARLARLAWTVQLSSLGFLALVLVSLAFVSLFLPAFGLLLPRQKYI